MDEKEIYISISISSSLSLIGCLMMIIVYFKYSELQSFAFKLIAYLAFLDLLHSILFLIPTYESASTDNICICQAFFITIVTLESVIWTSVISICLYVSVVKEANMDLYINKIFLYVTVFCISVSFIPMLNGMDGYAARLGWCWIKDDLFKFILLYFPLWLIIILNAVIYMIVIRRIKSEFGKYRELISSGKPLIRKLRMYPILLIISFTPVTILRFLESIQEQSPVELIMISGVFTCLNGFLNFMVYGCTQQVREAVFRRSRYVFIDLSEANSISRTSSV